MNSRPASSEVHHIETDSGRRALPWLALVLALGATALGWLLELFLRQDVFSLLGGASGTLMLFLVARRLSEHPRRPISVPGNELPVTLSERAAEARRLVIAASRTDNAVIIIDAHRRIEWVNDVFTRISGRTLEEIHEEPPESILQGVEAAPGAIEALRRHLERGEGFSIEAVNHDKSGRKYWLAFDVQPIYAASGRVTNLIAIGRDVTDRKRTEEALRESEARFQTLAKHSPVGICQTDAEGSCLYLNERCCELMGLTQEEARESGWTRALHPDDRERIVGEWQRAVSQKSAFNKCEYRFVCPDGVVSWVFGEAAPQRDDTGRIVGYVGTITDISDRMKAEEALRESEQRVRAIIETSPECVKLLAADGIVLDINPAGLAMVEAERSEDVVGSSIYPLISPEHREAFQALNEGVCRGTPGSLEFELISLKGHRRWMETRAVPLRNPADGSIIQLGFTHDITDRKRADETRSELAAIVESSDDAIVGTTAEGIVTSWNRGAQSLYGFSARETIGLSLSVLLAPERSAELTFLLGRIGQGSHVENFETVGIRKGGAQVQVAMTVSPIRGSSGGIVGTSIIARDITIRKRADEELERARTAALEAVRFKSEFLANMSHEIRTPMNGVIGMTELVLEMELSSELREYVETIKSSSDALLTIINDILDFSKIEAGKLEVESIPFSPRNTLRETLRPLSIQAHRKGLELACHVPPEVPDALLGDPGRMRQILANLVGNAIKFTEHGEVAVRVGVESQSTTKVELHVEVTDTGIGIPLEKQRLIFEAFAQADGSTTRKYGGTGLGLAIVTQLLELMGGRIWVESEAGSGSTFHFTVPLVLDQTERAAVSLAPTQQLQGLDVLIVDDNATNRLILVEMVKSWGMRPEEATGALPALAALARMCDRGTPFSLALLDVQMPEVDGFALAERIRRDDKLSRIPLVLLTSSGQRGDALRCREMGVAGYLTKPVMSSDLLEAIQAVLGSRVDDQPGRLVTRHSLRESRARLRVLVAEDNQLNRTVAQRLLERRGHTVVVVADGREALAELQRGSFDIALMDVQMPWIDGFEATALIRQREKETGDHLPIIALTAHAMKGDRERCLAAGMDDYVAKPLEAGQLFDAIERLVPGPAVEASTRSTAARGAGLLDLESILARVDGDYELLSEIMKMFLDERPRLMAEIREAMERGDVESLLKGAHRLKGALGTLAARPAAEAARRVEAIAENGDLAGGAEALALLEKEMERLEPELDALAKGSVLR